MRSDAARWVLEVAKNGILLSLVLISLVLHRQLWMVGPGEEHSPYTPPARLSTAMAEAFWADHIYIGTGGEEHARLSRDHGDYLMFWDSTLRILSGLDRSAMVLVRGSEADDYLRSLMSESPGWQAVFSAAIPLDLWWEIWREDFQLERLDLETVSLVKESPPVQEDQVELLAQVVDRIWVFITGPGEATVLAGDGVSFLAARVIIDTDSLEGLQARMQSILARLPIYRGVPPEWMGTPISASVLVPEMDVYRPAFIYLGAPEEPPWEQIKDFFFDHGRIREMAMDGFKAYTNGRVALRVYDSGAITYFSGQPPGSGPGLPWLFAVREVSWYVEAHGGWPERVRLGRVIMPSGEALKELVRQHVLADSPEDWDSREFLAGRPWPESFWAEVGGIGFTFTQELEGHPLEGDHLLEIWVSRRGLLRFSRFEPRVVGAASDSRVKPPFGAIADALSGLPEQHRPERVVTGVYPGFFLPSVSREGAHLSAVWVVKFADGEKFYVHATTGTILGRGR